MLKYYGVLFTLLLVVVGGKIFPQSAQIHIFGAPALTNDRVHYNRLKMAELRAIGY